MASTPINWNDDVASQAMCIQKLISEHWTGSESPLLTSLTEPQGLVLLSPDLSSDFENFVPNINGEDKLDVLDSRSTILRSPLKDFTNHVKSGLSDNSVSCETPIKTGSTRFQCPTSAEFKDFLTSVMEVSPVIQDDENISLKTINEGPEIGSSLQASSANGNKNVVPVRRIRKGTFNLDTSTADKNIKDIVENCDIPVGDTEKQKSNILQYMVNSPLDDLNVVDRTNNNDVFTTDDFINTIPVSNGLVSRLKLATISIPDSCDLYSSFSSSDKSCDSDQSQSEDVSDSELLIIIDDKPKSHKKSKLKKTQLNVTIENIQPDTAAIENIQQDSAAIENIQQDTAVIENDQPDATVNDQPGNIATVNDQPGTSATVNDQPGTSATVNDLPGTSATVNDQPGTSATVNDLPGTTAIENAYLTTVKTKYLNKSVESKVVGEGQVLSNQIQEPKGTFQLDSLHNITIDDETVVKPATNSGDNKPSSQNLQLALLLKQESLPVSQKLINVADKPRPSGLKPPSVKPALMRPGELQSKLRLKQTSAMNKQPEVTPKGSLMNGGDAGLSKTITKSRPISSRPVQNKLHPPQKINGLDHKITEQPLKKIPSLRDAQRGSNRASLGPMKALPLPASNKTVQGRMSLSFNNNKAVDNGKNEKVGLQSKVPIQKSLLKFPSKELSNAVLKNKGTVSKGSPRKLQETDQRRVSNDGSRTVTKEKPLTCSGAVTKEKPLAGLGTVTKERPLACPGTIIKEKPLACPGTIIKEKPLACPGTIIKEKPLACPGTIIKEKPLACPGTIIKEKPLACPGTIIKEKPTVSEGTCTEQQNEVDDTFSIDSTVGEVQGFKTPRKNEKIIVPRRLSNAFSVSSVTAGSQMKGRTGKLSLLPTPNRSGHNSSSGPTSQFSFRMPSPLTNKKGNDEDLEAFKSKSSLVKNTPDVQPRRRSMWSPVKKEPIRTEDRVYQCTKRLRQDQNGSL